MTFQDALRKLLADNNMTVNELAEKTGVKQPSISGGWLKTGTISTDKLFTLSKIFNVDAEALSEGRIEYLKPMSSFCTIPILSEIPAGPFSEIILDSLSDVEYLPVHCKFSKCFALRIDGKSMEPEYHKGDYIIIDPDLLPQNGNDVVGYIENYDKATFKRFRERYTNDGKLYFELYPLNSDYPTYSSLTMKIAIRGVKVAWFKEGK